MSHLSALQRPQFRRYFISAVSGVNAMWVFRVLLSWSGWDLTGSASFVGMIAALTLLPAALTGPLFGALIDRSEIRKAFFIVCVGLLACPMTFVLMMVTGTLTATSLTGLALAFGFAIAAYQPVRQSLGPRLVERDQIGAVVALAALNFNVGRVISPMIGGIVIANLGLTLTGVISAVLFLPNLVVILTLRPRALPARKKRNYVAELAEGASEVFNRPIAWQAMLMASLGLGPIRALSEILPLLADGVYGKGAAGLGLLTSCIGAGALIAAVLQVATGHRLVQRPALPWIVLMIGHIGTAGMVWLPHFTLVAMASTLCGFASAFLAVWLQTRVQSGIPDALRGRVMSFWTSSVTLSTSVLAYCVSVGSEWVGLSVAVLLMQLLLLGILSFHALLHQRYWT